MKFRNLNATPEDANKLRSATLTEHEHEVLMSGGQIILRDKSKRLLSWQMPGTGRSFYSRAELGQYLTDGNKLGSRWLYVISDVFNNNDAVVFVNALGPDLLSSNAIATVQGRTFSVHDLDIANGTFTEDEYGNTQLAQDILDALNASFLPNASNPFATINQLYSDVKADFWFINSYFPYLGSSSFRAPIESTANSFSNPIPLLPNDTNFVYPVSANRTLYVTMPTTAIVPYADYGCNIYIDYPYTYGNGSIVPFHAITIVVVNIELGTVGSGNYLSFDIYPGDSLKIVRSPTSSSATVKDYKIKQASNTRFSGRASFGFMPAQSEPPTPAVGEGGYLWVDELGNLKYKGPGGAVKIVATP